MTYEELETNLNEVFEHLRLELKEVADAVQQDKSRTEISDAIKNLADGLCRRWPFCLERHPELSGKQSN